MKSRFDGYTILEALIFLAVSGLLFAAIYPTFVGRDNKTKFTQSVRDLESKINDIINDVSTGYFPSSPTKCEVNGGIISFSGISTNDQQGTRKDCIFIGKVISFNEKSSETPTMDIITIVGKRTAENNSSPVTIAEATPTAVSPTPTIDDIEDLTETYQTTWGVPITKIVNLDNSAFPPNPEIGAIGIMFKLDSANISDQKSAELYPVSGIDRSSPLSRKTVVGVINGTNTWTKNDDFIICLDNPYTNDTEDVAAIRIEGQSNSIARAIFGKENIETEVGGVCG